MNAVIPLLKIAEVKTVQGTDPWQAAINAALAAPATSPVDFAQENASAPRTDWDGEDGETTVEG